MKILFVLEHYYPYIGGAERLFTQLARTLVQSGYPVTVVTTRHDRSLPAREVLNGVRIFRVRCFNRYLFTLLSLPRILQQARDCSLIHTTTYNAALPAWLAGQLLRKPVVVTFHEVWGKLWWQLPFTGWWQKRGYYLYERLVLKLSFHRYIAVSHYTKNCLEQAGIPSGRIATIYNGLDYASFQSHRRIQPPVFTYTYFGRLGISKGLDLLLPAAQQFCSKYPESRLQLILPRKPKPVFKRVQRLIRQLKLDSHIVLLHDLPRRQLYRTLSSSSCVVIPSYSEGFCFAAAEAAALQVPTISSQRGALKEVVNGQYLPIKPLNATALSEALEKAANGQWQELPRKRFPLERTVEQHLELYRCLLGQKRNSW
ncbi:MAG: glycosyltransferase family 4 protein [Lewinellaceae bacterium]|nr:glycosyltransferase family 4 protein [Phaeodactylibacter sp.]MCB9037176.1 glycosyltransferase family 4 protein [Lewinellaceae bacterium]